MRIKRLPPSIVRRIAAGEVVERPASVVKELIENALDAGATRVVVKVEDGGIGLVEVWDNGCGMTEEEALLAVERHTTSKIAKEEDLYAISSFGFRGEALYAISSVSQFRLLTRTKYDELATSLVVEGGVLKRVERAFRREPGTTVTVRNLFFNLRARRRFLKGKRIEAEHVRKVVYEYSISHPHLLFEYYEDGELVARFVPQDLEKRLEAVLGAGLLKSRVEDGIKLFLLKDNRAQFFLFVNRRAVQDRSLAYAVRGILKQRFLSHELPSVVLFLEIPPRDVDVNVHPTKREVRFRNRTKVHQQVERALKALFEERAGSVSYGYSQPVTPEVREATFLYQPAFNVETGSSCYRYLGEVGEVYMLFAHRDGALVVVDKHALHEGVIFEKVKTETKRIPVFIPLEDASVVEWREYLEGLGFGISEDGVLTEVPSWAYGKEARIVRTLLEELKQESPVDPSYEEMARIACRAAVKAGDRSTEIDAKTVARFLEERGEEITCPHGRPVVVRLDRKDLDLLFKRRK